MYMIFKKYKLISIKNSIGKKWLSDKFKFISISLSVNYGPLRFLMLKMPMHDI